MQLNDTSLDKIKDEVINSILNDLTSSENLTPQEIQLKRQELEQQIKAKQLITQLRPQGGTTNAKDISDTIEELYIDILTTFGYVNSLDSAVDKHISINQATINNIKALIAKANDRIDIYESILGSQGNPNQNIEGFRNADSFEEKKIFFTERFGENIPVSSRAYFNAREEYISLNYLRNQNMMTYKNGVSLGTINIRKQLGGALIRIKNDINSPENAIDTSMQSYWGESILCDEPLRVVFDSVRPDDPMELQDYYYGVQNGALCELELCFEAVSIVNEVALIPYGQYPIEIIAIRYKTSDDTEEPFKEIICPDNSNETLRGKTISGPASFRFPDTVCKRLYIVFNQQHYVKSTYIYSPNEIFKNQLWFDLTSKNTIDPKVKDALLFGPNYLDRSVNDAAWNFINDMSVKNKVIDLKTVLFGQNRPNMAATKYQYTYGFYNIAPNFNEFERTGVYVSKPIPANGNIKSMRITTDEGHPLDDHGLQWTDIEYYATYAKEPTLEDWFPILPTNIDHIECELLQTASSQCPLRFPAKQVIGVYNNGAKMDKDLDYFVITDSTGKIIAIDIPNFDYYVKYTVSYIPVPESTILTLIDDDGESIRNSFESIQGANESYYTLSDYPYISTTNTVATDVRIVDKITGTTQFQSAGDIVCVTDPYNPSESYKLFDKQSKKIQYYTDRNYIYFNTKVTSNQLIEINYDHCVSEVRLKAILRRNTLKLGWVTPTLTKIKYEFTTID